MIYVDVPCQNFKIPTSYCMVLLPRLNRTRSLFFWRKYGNILENKKVFIKTHHGLPFFSLNKMEHDVN